MTLAMLSTLHPPIVWRHFATLCHIPRPSKQEAELRDHLIDWAQQQGLTYEVDAVGNLLLRKPASPGCESAPGVVLQGHLDMVCQKNEGVDHDFSRDPIQAVIQDGWLRSPGTTLGADNGIGVALALAALEDRHLQHGPLEVLLTVDEEAGMGGAHGLQADWLRGQLMLNLDTEEWGEFYMGCAGGLDVDISRTCSPEVLTEHGARHLEVRLSGLRGGHSGVNIHEERGNAIKLLSRVLVHACREHPQLRLVSCRGGTARNALPREATAQLVCTGANPQDCMAQVSASLKRWEQQLQDELRGVDDHLQLHGVVTPCPPGPLQVLPRTEQAIWLDTLHAAPHGVFRMSQDVAGVVETSNNVGMLHLTPQGGDVNFMVRSLRDSGAQALADQICSLWRLSGTQARQHGHYPGWAPNPGSRLLKVCQDVYAREFGATSHVQVIHAGLECGLIGAKYPEMDMVSFGPTIRGAHAPGEGVDIASVDRCWQLLRAILTTLAQPDH